MKNNNPRIWIGLWNFLLFFFFLFTFARSLFALEIPSAPQGRINDYARMFSPQAVTELYSILSNYEVQTHQKIIIATFDTLEGENLEDFSGRLARRWQIGTKENEGILIIMIKQDRFVRIKVSPGLAQQLNENQNFQIVAHHIVPNFRKGDYDKGIIDTVKVIINYLQDSGQPKRDVRNNKQSKILLAGIAILFFLLLAIVIYKMKRKDAPNDDGQ